MHDTSILYQYYNVLNRNQLFIRLNMYFNVKGFLLTICNTNIVI